MSTEQSMKMKSDGLGSSPAFAITGSMTLSQLQLPPYLPDNKGVASDNRVLSEVHSFDLDPISAINSWAALDKSLHLSLSHGVNMRLSRDNKWEFDSQCLRHHTNGPREDFIWPLPAFRLYGSVTQEGCDCECD